jgi:hypothetical protein
MIRPHKVKCSCGEILTLPDFSIYGDQAFCPCGAEFEITPENTVEMIDR